MQGKLHKDAYIDMLLVLSSTVFFYIVRLLCHNYTPIPLHLSLEQKERLHNYTVSFIHAAITSVLCVTCFYLHPEFTDHIITKFYRLHHAVVIFATGYFLYDAIDNISSRPFEKCKDILLHHVITFLSFLFAILTRELVGLGILALMSELSSVCLHARQLVKLMFDRDNNLYAAVSLATIFSFVIFRIFLIYYLIFKLFDIGHAITQPYRGLIWCAFIIMSIVNFVLFNRLIKSDVVLWQRKIKLR